MKILFLAAANNIHTVRWVNSLSRKGHEVYLVSNGNHVNGEDRIDKEVKIKKMKFSGNLGYYLNVLELRKIFKNIKPDIVNAHYASGYGTLARLARLEPLILSLWGSDVYIFPYKNQINLNVLRKNLNHAHIIASTSYAMAKQTEKILKRNVDIKITPFGVDTEHFKPSELEREERRITFGVVKTLNEIYGIEYIIKAFALLNDRILKEKIRYDINLEIYGKGELEEELKQLCKDLTIEHIVNFNGYVPNKDIPLALNKMDIFCLGSISESFGVAAVEAMACGIPVIATSAEGFKEVIVDEETGFIVPVKDSENMAGKMYELMINSEIRKQMGRKGRERVLELYDWDRNVEVMESIYRRGIQ